MKEKKLLNKLKAFFGSSERKRKKQKSDVKEILKKLKKRERRIKQKQSSEKKAAKRKQLQREIDVIYAQRKKGIKLIRKL